MDTLVKQTKYNVAQMTGLLSTDKHFQELLCKPAHCGHRGQGLSYLNLMPSPAYIHAGLGIPKER